MNRIKHRILDNIETLIDRQTLKGVETYGHTLDDCPHKKYDWQQMIIEELIDALQYQQKMIGADKQELIKSNIESNRKIEDLEAENAELAAAYARVQKELKSLK